MNIILLGAPGAGKGTLAARIKENFLLAHISTGDALRAQIKAGTELGINAKSYIDKGQLVPDVVVVGIVAAKMAEPECKAGAMLDGFPRTIAQAEALSEITNIDCVICLEVPYDVLITRISGRRMCPCGETYHTSFYAKSVCAKCGAPLYQREDDNEETVKSRLEVYEKQTAPLIEYYKNKGILYKVNGNAQAEEVFSKVKVILNDYR